MPPPRIVLAVSVVGIIALAETGASGKTLKQRVVELEQRVRGLEEFDTRRPLQGPIGPTGPSGPPGAAGPPGPPGAVRGYALVDPNVSADASNPPRFVVNKGFTSVIKGTRGNLSEGVYCLTGVDPSIPPGTAPVATVEAHFTSASAVSFEVDVDSSAADCSPGAIEIDTFADGVLTDGIAFTVVVP